MHADYSRNLSLCNITKLPITFTFVPKLLYTLLLRFVRKNLYIRANYVLYILYEIKVIHSKIQSCRTISICRDENNVYLSRRIFICVVLLTEYLTPRYKLHRSTYVNLRNNFELRVRQAASAIRPRRIEKFKFARIYRIYQSHNVRYASIDFVAAFRNGELVRIINLAQ